MEVALQRKFWEPRNSPKFPYYSKGIFLGLFYEIVRFCGKSSYGGLWGRWTGIRSQNLGGTLFSSSGHHFCTKFWHNSRTEGRTFSGTFPLCFSTCFTYGGCTLTKIFGTTESSINAFTIVTEFFWVNLLKSFDFAEKAVMEVYGVAELESILKIWWHTF